MKRLFLLLAGTLSLLFPQLLKAQQLQATLVDAETLSPVEAASIFIANSTLGTLSRADGQFSLFLEDLQQGKLVISKTGYERSTFDLVLGRGFPILCTYSPNSWKWKLLSSRARASPPRKRRRWIKQFEDAMLGNGPNRQGSKILNAEVLLFSQKKRVLKAFAFEPIQILNRDLGYQLQFYLDTFSMNRKSELVYAGKVFFEELETQGQTAGRERLREQTYAHSQANVLRKLVNNRFDEKLYEVGLAELVDGKGANYQAISPTDLQIRRGLQQDTILLSKGLVITDKTIFRSWTDHYAPMRKIKLANSMLIPTKGKIIIARSGHILNPEEIEELGHWTENRLADLLPINYQPKDGDHYLAAMRLVDSLQLHLNRYPQEKVYLHFNQPYYSNREDIYFQAYLLDAQSHSPSSLSKLLYVDLINPAGELVDSLVLHRDKSFAGIFQLNDSLDGGIYQVRAYTRHMRNFAPAFFFRQGLQIIGNKGLAPKTNVTRTNTSDEEIQLQFHPEGDQLIQDIRQKLAFQVQDKDGNPIQLSGKLIDQDQKELLTFNTHYPGYGLFNISPKAGATYQALVTHGGKSYRFSLPPVHSQGVYLEVNAIGETEIFLQAKANPDSLVEDVFVIGHLRGNIFGVFQYFKPEVPVKIYKSKLPEGLLCFSLFNRHGDHLGDRLVFNDKSLLKQDLTFRTDERFYRSGDSIYCEFSLTDSLFLGSENLLSVSITDTDYMPYSEASPNISSYLHFGSDLGEIPHDAEQIKQTEDAQARFNRDLNLLSQEWQRFDWKTILNQQKPTKVLSYKAEQGFSIRGYAHRKRKKEKRIMANMLINSMDSTFLIAKTATDSLGNFVFYNMPFVDSTTFFVQGRIPPKKQKVSEDELMLEGNKFVEFVLQEQVKPIIQANPPVYNQLTLEKQTALTRRAAYLDSLENINYEITLAPVAITGTNTKYNRLRGNNTYLLDNEPWIPPEMPAMEIMRSLRPRLRYTRNVSTGDLTLTAKAGNAEAYVSGRPRIFINGLESNHLYFQSLKADMIDMISIQGFVIYVTTRHKGLRSQQHLPPSGTLAFVHPGFPGKADFKLPLIYDRGDPNSFEDLRTALHWEPSIQFNATGKAAFKFKAAQGPAKYCIRVEGLIGNVPIFKQFFVEVNE